jgi:hypothetical protein
VIPRVSRTLDGREVHIRSRYRTSLPGHARRRAPVYVDGQLAATLSGPTLADDFLRLLDEYVERRFGSSAPRS